MFDCPRKSDRKINCVGSMTEWRLRSLAVRRELDNAQSFEFLQVAVNLAVVAVDSICCLADTLGLLRDDGFDEGEIWRAHETGDVVELLEVQDVSDILLGRGASLAVRPVAVAPRRPRGASRAL